MKRALLLTLLLASCGVPGGQTPLAVPEGATPAPRQPAPAASATARPEIPGRIVFSKNHDLWLYAGSAPSQLTTMGAVQNPAWSPADGELAFDRAGKNSADLWLLPSLGGTPRALTNNASAAVDNNFWEMQPDWTPDGKALVYASDRARTRTGTLDLAAWRMTLDTKARAQLSGANAYTGGIDRPRMRPNGNPLVLYTSWTYPENSLDAYGQLTLLDTRMNRAWRLSEPGQTLLQASWSPDGARAAFIWRTAGQDQLWIAPVPYVVGADTNIADYASFLEAGVNAQPAWSPRGDAIAYIGLKDGSFDLFVQRLTAALAPDGSAIQITHGQHVDADSSISWGT
jgi:Tol biopolymer transport system component